LSSIGLAYAAAKTAFTKADIDLKKMDAEKVKATAAFAKVNVTWSARLRDEGAKKRAATKKAFDENKSAVSELSERVAMLQAAK